MASTCPPRPPEIFQDPATSSFDNLDTIPMNPNLPALAPLRPVLNAQPKAALVFEPPPTGPNAPSPLKVWRPSTSPPKAPSPNRPNTIAIPPPMAPVFATDSPRKKPAASTFPTSAVPRPQQALFTTFQTSFSADKENAHAHALMPFGPGHMPKGANKRLLQEAAPARDRQPKRARLDEPVVELPIPEPADMPAVEDDGNKPPYSYAMLIGMSILRAPNRRLTLAQIYKWISDSFLHYRTVETGWQNSIRHNLSLNKAFVKRERPKDDPGKGNYWMIAPGCESHFLKEKQGRRPLPLGVVPAPPPPMPMPKPKPVANAPRPGSGGVEKCEAAATTTAAVPGRLAPRPSAPAPSSRARDELSSDATISASDGLARDLDAPSAVVDPSPPSRLVRSSPPPITSSPPAMLSRHRSAREATPPSARRFPAPSSWSRKRKARAMHDSGYFSSLDSSALRPNAAAATALLTSEAEIDRPRTNSGRAEEELARTRRASHDSPSMLRSVMRPAGAAASAAAFASSSPIRAFEGRLKLPPLTPATIFKVPAKPAAPPASASPNTNLRNHRNRIRQLVGSPVKNGGVGGGGGGGLLTDDLPWSPAFNLEHESYMFHTEPANAADVPGNDFDIFSDSPVRQFTPRLTPASASASAEAEDEEEEQQQQRCIKRPRLERARTSASILADITGHRSNAHAFLGAGATTTTTPIPKFPYLRSPAFSRSPSKSPTPAARRRQQQQRRTSAAWCQENLFGVGGLLVDELAEDDDDEHGHGNEDRNEEVETKLWDPLLHTTTTTLTKGDGKESMRAPARGGGMMKMMKTMTGGSNGHRPGLGRSSTSRF